MTLYAFWVLLLLLQEVMNSLYVRPKTLISVEAKKLLWGAVCAKIECDFSEVFFVDLPKIVQIVRDLVNGTLRFSKWDAAI